MQTQKRKRYQKDSAPTDDIITLIHLVRQNPALYNYKLQPNQRRRADVLNGWAHIASQIGNKYTVEECRRKWKNLRDTYHQYRLRKPKLGDGLLKWRYAKDLEFLSTVYQPKLKSNRNQNYVISSMRLRDIHDPNAANTVTTTATHEDEHDAASGMHHIALVNGDAETFILTTYEESVNDDVANTITDEGPTNNSHMELTTHHGESVDEHHIVKHEHTSPLDDDDDGATGAEVDYEEVCLYEEAGNAPSVDCETIIGSAASGVARSTSTDSKTFQYIDANDFCIGSINPHTGQLSSSGGANGGGAIKLKNLASTVTTLPSNTNVTVVSSNNGNNNNNHNNNNNNSLVGATIMQMPVSAMNSPTLSVATSAQTQTREELDLFFDFLKKKIQRFSKQEITAIQVEFLNCVLRREAK